MGPVPGQCRPSVACGANRPLLFSSLTACSKWCKPARRTAATAISVAARTEAQERALHLRPKHTRIQQTVNWVQEEALRNNGTVGMGLHPWVFRWDKRGVGIVTVLKSHLALALSTSLFLDEGKPSTAGLQAWRASLDGQLCWASKAGFLRPVSSQWRKPGTGGSGAAFVALLRGGVCSSAIWGLGKGTGAGSFLQNGCCLPKQKTTRQPPTVPSSGSHEGHPPPSFPTRVSKPGGQHSPQPQEPRG